MHTLGIIGYGGMARWHHKHVGETGCVSATAVYDIDPAKVADGERAGLKGFHTLEEFLDSRLFDIVLVATPNNFHCELTCAALEAGYHVVCEKPVAMSVGELDQMTATAERCGKLFTVHQNRRWDTDFVKVRKALEENLVGKPYTIESCVHGCGGVIQGWRAYKVAGGGMLFDWGVHIIDQILCMVSEPVTDVACYFDSIRTAEVDDYFKLLLRFENGLNVQLEVGTYCLKQKPRWYINGEAGSLIIQDWDCNGAIIHSALDGIDWEPEVVQTKAGPTRTMAPRPKETLTELPLPEEIGEWTDFYKNVAAAIDGVAEPAITHSQLRRVMQVIEAAFEAAETGHSVAVHL